MGGWKDGGQLMKCFAPFSRGELVRKVVYRRRMDAFPHLCWTLSRHRLAPFTQTPHIRGTSVWNLTLHHTFPVITLSGVCRECVSCRVNAGGVVSFLWGGVIKNEALKISVSGEGACYLGVVIEQPGGCQANCRCAH